MSAVPGSTSTRIGSSGSPGGSARVNVTIPIMMAAEARGADCVTKLTALNSFHISNVVWSSSAFHRMPALFSSASCTFP